jgi:hypothetical protein
MVNASAGMKRKRRILKRMLKKKRALTKNSEKARIWRTKTFKRRRLHFKS